MSFSIHISELCGETRWKPYHTSLGALEERVKKIIQDYAKGVCTEETCRPIVLVAPYGSGKTELAKHICQWCWSRGIPALIVNLSHAYEFIYERYRKKGRKITETELVNMLQEFFEYVLNRYRDLYQKSKELKEVVMNYMSGRVKGVLIIDEIEETFNAFRQLIVYETTPWRALFEAVRERKSSFVPILLYGPSSELAEAIHMSGMWRVLVFSIPLLPPDGIERELLRSVPDPHYRKLLANALFWLGRGRIGLVTSLINNDIVRLTMSRLDKIKHERNYITKLEHLWFDLFELIGRDIVENVKMFDIMLYRRHLDELDEDEKNLFKLLTVLVGPIPARKLGELFDLKRIEGAKLHKIVRSRYYISKAKLVDEIESFAEEHLLKRIRSNGDLKEALNYLRSIVDWVFDAWSYNDVIILQQTSEEPLKWLKEIAGTIAFEMYRPEVAEALDKIDIKHIAEKLREKGEVYELEEDYYAIHPQVILDIYPPIMAKPLIACSREASKGELNSALLEFTERTGGVLDDELIKYIAGYARDETLKKIIDAGVKVYLLTEQKLEKHISVVEERLMSDLGGLIEGRGTRRALSERPIHIVIPLPLNRDPAEIKNIVEDNLRHLVNIGLVSVLDVSPKIALFVQGLVYCYEKCRDRIENLNPLDRFIIVHYANVFSKAVTESVAQATSRHTEISISLRNMDRILREVKELRARKEHEVGAEQARYFWLLASVRDEEGGNFIKPALVELLEALENLSSISERLVNKLYAVKRDLKRDELRDRIMSGVSLLTKGRARHYFQLSEKLAKLLSSAETVSSLTRGTDVTERLDDVKRFVKALARVVVGREKCKEILEKRSLLATFKETLSYLEAADILHRTEDDPAAYMIAAPIFLEIVNDVCGDSRTNMVVRLNMKILAMNRWSQSLASIYKEIAGNMETITETLERLGIASNVDVIKSLKEFEKVLSELVNEMNNIVNRVMEYSNKLWTATFSACKLYEEFMLEKVLNRFVQNIDSSLHEINDIKVSLDSVVGLLERVEEGLNRLQQARDILKSLTGRDVVESLKKDLERLFTESSSLRELHEKSKIYVEERRYMEWLLEIIEEEHEILRIQSELREELNRLRQLVETL